MPTIYRKVIIDLVTGEKKRLYPVEMTDEQYLNYLSLYADIASRSALKRMKKSKEGSNV